MYCHFRLDPRKKPPGAATVSLAPVAPVVSEPKILSRRDPRRRAAVQDTPYAPTATNLTPLVSLCPPPAGSSLHPLQPGDAAAASTPAAALIRNAIVHNLHLNPGLSGAGNKKFRSAPFPHSALNIFFNFTQDSLNIYSSIPPSLLLLSTFSCILPICLTLYFLITYFFLSFPFPLFFTLLFHISRPPPPAKLQPWIYFPFLQFIYVQYSLLRDQSA